ncbi:MAG TPA: hypothetical protein VF691_09015, partial [Cytophagaceae bacterium]
DGVNWTKPENLGPVVNTESDELYPSLQQDSILYFSSNGHGGLGGLDILKTCVVNDNFTRPLENLGYPINSKMDDFGITWASEVEGFIASNRKEGKNDYNLFYFVLNKVPLKATVISSIDGKHLNDITLKLMENGKQKDLISKTDSNGYQFMVYPGKQYVVEGSGFDYRMSTTKVSTKGIKNLEPINVNVTMKKVHQVFVNGVTKDDSSNTAVNAKLRIVDAKTSKQISIKSDPSGEFYAEIYPDQESYLVAESGYKKDIIKLLPAGVKNASISYNVYPRLKKPSRLKYNKVLEKIEGHQSE